MSASPPARPDRALGWRWAGCIYAAALALRFAYLGTAAADPTFWRPYLDSLWHLQWASAIAHGTLLGAVPFYRPPLYPYFLAGVLALTGGDLLGVRIVQIALGALTPVLVGVLGARMFGRAAGVTAGLLYAGAATVVLTDFELLSPVVLLPLVVGALLALERAAREPSGSSAFVLGLLIGLAAIARPDILPFAPVAAALVAVPAWRSGWYRREMVRGGVALAVGLAIPIVPVTAVNAIVGHDTVLICSNGGVNLYLGNNPDADGFTPLMPGPTDTASYAPDGTYTDNVMSSGRYVARVALGREPKPSEVSRYWTRRVLAWAWSHPGAWAALMARKAFYLIGGFEIGDTKNLTYYLEAWRPFAVLPRWWWVFPLAAAGLTIPGDRRQRAILGAYVATYAAAIVAFLVVDRYRLVIVPALCVLAGRFLVWAVGEARAGRWRPLALRAALAATLALLVTRDPTGYTVRERVESRIARAGTSERVGDPARAESLLLDALALDPTGGRARSAYAAFLARHGRLAEAGALGAPVRPGAAPR